MAENLSELTGISVFGVLVWRDDTYFLAARKSLGDASEAFEKRPAPSYALRKREL